MALTVSNRLVFRATQNVLQNAVEAWPAVFTPYVSHDNALADGTGTGQADLMYAAERTVASATNDDIDLQGSLTDIYGTSFLGAKLVGLFVINRQADGTANTTDLTVGGHPTAPALTGAYGPVGPGGHVALYSPGANGLQAIQATTNDILRIANSSGASNTYQILVMIRSA